MNSIKPLDPTTPCGHRPEDMPCETCSQYGCRVYADRPAPKREIPEWLKNAVGLKMVEDNKNDID